MTQPLAQQELKAETEPTPVQEQVQRRNRTRWRRRLGRMIGVPLLAATALVAMVLVLRDFTNRNDRLALMRDLGRQVADFQDKYDRLPTAEQVSRFQIASRMPVESIIYDADRVLPNAPETTVLAYTPELGTTFLPPGHAVLTVGGHVSWLSPNELAQRIELREQHYRYHLPIPLR